MAVALHMPDCKVENTVLDLLCSISVTEYHISVSACHLVSTTPFETQVISVDRLIIWLPFAKLLVLSCQPLLSQTTKKTDD